MKCRCESPKYHGYHLYGGQGVVVCREWAESVKKFIEWAVLAGWEEGLEIDRIDNRGDYEPDNCHFVTKSKNCQNRSSSKVWYVKGKVFPSSVKAGLFFGVNKKTIMRWCDGYTTATGKFKPPKTSCSSRKRYLQWGHE